MAESCLLRKEYINLDVEAKQIESEILKSSFWMIKVESEFYVFGNEIAAALNYKDPKKAIQENVDPDEKKSIEEILGNNYKKVIEKSLKSSRGKTPRPDFFYKLQKTQNLLTELGIYYFCTKSRMEKAKPFQKWLFGVIKKVRKTGSYTLPCGPINNPLSLVDKVSNLEKEIETLKKETKRTCDKETQTDKSVIVLDGSFRDLEDKIIKTLKRNKSSLKRSIEEIRLDLKRYNRSSFSSSSSSPHRLYYSSDSE